jgi:uroporphyrinogen decarboxylase
MLALNHKEPDRIPIDLGGTTITSIHNTTYMAVRRHVGLPVEEIETIDPIQQTPRVAEDFFERFSVDFRMVQLPHAGSIEVFEDGDYFAFVDRFGAKLRMPKDGGLYFDWVEFPLREFTPEELDRYAWPEPDPIEDVLRLRDRARKLYETTDHALVGGAVIGGGIFEQPCRMMGLEQFMMSLVDDPRYAERLTGRLTDLYIASCDRYLDEVGPYIQVFLFWDDVAGQDGWLISPETYRRIIKPSQRRLFEAIKRKTDAKIFYHGCGAAFELIGDLIDIGVDIFNPVQVSARGMDTRRLKETYGRDIVFWGGGVDTQRVLPFGTPDEVRDEVKRRIDDLAPGGGFVFAAVHNIQAFVPPENVVAAFDTALEYGRYASVTAPGEAQPG